MTLVRSMFAVSAVAVVGASQFVVRPAGSRVTVSGTSTVRDWTCAAVAFEGSADAAGASAAAVARGAAPAAVARFVVPVTALDCRNGTMNAHLRKALKATDHPQVVFTVTGAEVVAGGEARLTGTLRIAGHDAPVVVAAQVSAEGDALRVRGSHVVAMPAWGITPPTLMLGALKVGPTVTVAFDLTLAP